MDEVYEYLIAAYEAERLGRNAMAHIFEKAAIVQLTKVVALHN